MFQNWRCKRDPGKCWDYEGLLSKMSYFFFRSHCLQLLLKIGAPDGFYGCMGTITRGFACRLVSGILFFVCSHAAA